MPIAIASENSSASMSGREKATLITKIETVRTPATFTSRREKPRRPTWKAVSAWRSESPAAMPPNAVALPVATTTPRPGALVHDGAHEGARRQVERRVARLGDRGRLRDRQRLAGQDGLVAFELRGLDQPEVGGHDVADAQGDDVARDERCDVDAALLPVAPDERLVVDVAVQRRDGVRRAVLVDEPEPDAERDDRGDDRRVRRIAREARDGRRREQQQEQRVAQLPHEHRQAPRRAAR